MKLYRLALPRRAIGVSKVPVQFRFKNPVKFVVYDYAILFQFHLQIRKRLSIFLLSPDNPLLEKRVYKFQIITVLFQNVFLHKHFLIARYGLRTAQMITVHNVL